MEFLNKYGCDGYNQIITMNWKVKTAAEASKIAGGGSFSPATVTFCSGGANSGSLRSGWISSDRSKFVSGETGLCYTNKHGDVIFY